LGDFVADGFAAGDGFPAGLDAAAGLVAGDEAGFVAGDAAALGDGVGEGVTAGTASDDKAEFEPLIPGSDSNNAISMNEIAAPMVIFARMFCVPRGPKAVLETLLVNSAPASALPGCSNTTTTNTKQARINSPNRM